jgi:tRNA(fMet)-specific endonuclease VapC
LALILDTNAVSALLAGDQSIANLLALEQQHHLPIIVIGEYRYGLVRSSQEARLGSVFDLLIHQSIVLPIDLDTTVHYARVRDDLRKKGRPIPENDLWIAALAAQYGLQIVSRDLHFDEVTGIDRVVW